MGTAYRNTESAALCRKLGYTFRRPELLRQALTHRSHSIPHNERLEFLGDAVLNCAVAGLIFHHFPDLSEGSLSRIRANLVNQKMLAELAQTLELGKLIRFGEGELKSGGDKRPSILADALEAVIGAIYLDAGFEQAEKTVENLFIPSLGELNTHALGKDPKTLLQEYLQSRKLALPRYAVVATRGEAHQQQFQVECVISRPQIRTLGEGTSRRSAEQHAARQAYEQLQSH
ncbi:ribonuclease III [Nitrosospira multiformis]|uniref:Ribonuclease 3 n=1 Tax=Nitrosospira multiformis (strain ATCC 25196 / NCIMB 11849 / C 71) TaxID=323848 RepID=Q2Y871_NITMU|nr:ribonuclease III [Nitrosospira multiformis]ABB75050.1 RNAse III [Nitrosospira multiformis ATCC 25196]SEA55641.1 RNAse III [Nitrosospira multiformis]SEF83862.1 RNAse III [Nitrosospira multiformis ATCC 25196]